MRRAFDCWEIWKINLKKNMLCNDMKIWITEIHFNVCWLSLVQTKVAKETKQMFDIILNYEEIFVIYGWLCIYSVHYKETKRGKKSVEQTLKEWNRKKRSQEKRKTKKQTEHKMSEHFIHKNPMNLSREILLFHKLSISSFIQLLEHMIEIYCLLSWMKLKSSGFLFFTWREKKK